MTRSDPPNPTTDFFQQRLGCLTSVVEASRAVCADYAELADCEDLTVDELRGYAAQVVKAHEVSLKPLGTERQLLAFSVSTWEEDTQFLVVSVQGGCATTVQRLAHCLKISRIGCAEPTPPTVSLTAFCQFSIASWRPLVNAA